MAKICLPNCVNYGATVATNSHCHEPLPREMATSLDPDSDNPLGRKYGKIVSAACMDSCFAVQGPRIF